MISEREVAGRLVLAYQGMVPSIIISRKDKSRKGGTSELATVFDLGGTLIFVLEGVHAR